MRGRNILDDDYLKRLIAASRPANDEPSNSFIAGTRQLFLAQSLPIPFRKSKGQGPGDEGLRDKGGQAA